MVKGEIGRRAKVMSLGCQEGTARVWGMIATRVFPFVTCMRGSFYIYNPYFHKYINNKTRVIPHSFNKVTGVKRLSRG